MLGEGSVIGRNNAQELRPHLSPAHTHTHTHTHKLHSDRNGRMQTEKSTAMRSDRQEDKQ